MALPVPVILCDTPERVRAACRLLRGMYPRRSLAEIEEIAAKMSEEGWRMIGIFDAEGECEATISYLIGYRLFCGKYLQSESLFVNPERRKSGHAKRLFDWLEEKARAENCQRLLLQSFVENFPSHKFFYKQGYYIRGYVITKLLEGEEAV